MGNGHLLTIYKSKATYYTYFNMPKMYCYWFILSGFDSFEQLQSI